MGDLGNAEPTKIISTASEEVREACPIDSRQNTAIQEVQNGQSVEKSELASLCAGLSLESECNLGSGLPCNLIFAWQSSHGFSLGGAPDCAQQLFPVSAGREIPKGWTKTAILKTKM